MKIGNREFDVKNKTYIMGILNVTPDSFSDGGKWNDMDHALKHTEAMITEGADILDIGGESTRPGHTPVGAQEEIERILPVIEAVKGRFDIPISVDTYKGCVAEEALKHGADLINDIWGLKYDPEMAPVIARYQAPCCLMHNKDNTEYNNFIVDMLAETQECVNIAKRAGIADDKIILDPGVGFGKTYEMNTDKCTTLHNTDHRCGKSSLYTLIYRKIKGKSDHGFSGGTKKHRISQLPEKLQIIHGHQVHDIKENKRVIQMTEAILGR